MNRIEHKIDKFITDELVGIAEKVEVYVVRSNGDQFTVDYVGCGDNPQSPSRMFQIWKFLKALPGYYQSPRKP